MYVIHEVEFFLLMLVCFIIEYDTHDVLCLVSKYCLILSLFYDWVDTHDVLCIVSRCYDSLISISYNM